MEVSHLQRFSAKIPKDHEKNIFFKLFSFISKMMWMSILFKNLARKSTQGRRSQKLENFVFLMFSLQNLICQSSKVTLWSKHWSLIGQWKGWWNNNWLFRTWTQEDTRSRIKKIIRFRPFELVCILEKTRRNWDFSSTLFHYEKYWRRTDWTCVWILVDNQKDGPVTACR